MGCTNILYPWPCIHLCTENASLSFFLPLFSLLFGFSRFRLRPARCFFFTSTVLDFLPFCNLEKIIFFPLDVAVSFYPGRKMAFDVFLFFFFFFSAKEGFVYLCKRKQQTGFLGWFVGWFRVIYLIVLMEVSSSLTSFPFFSLLLVPKNCNETNKKFINFYFPPFLFPVSRSVMRYE